MVLSCFVVVSDFVVVVVDGSLSSTFVVFDAITEVVFPYVNVFCSVVGASVVGS